MDHVWCVPANEISIVPRRLVYFHRYGVTKIIAEKAMFLHTKKGFIFNKYHSKYLGSGRVMGSVAQGSFLIMIYDISARVFSKSAIDVFH